MVRFIRPSPELSEFGTLADQTIKFGLNYTPSLGRGCPAGAGEGGGGDLSNKSPPGTMPPTIPLPIPHSRA
jgi:hypothetical protein